LLSFKSRPTPSSRVQALSTIVQALPAGLRASVLVVMHSSTNGQGVLPQILERISSLPAAFATDGDVLVHGRIYIAPPDFQLIVGPNRDGLKTLIDSQPDLRVVGEASSEEEAVRIVAAVSAEIALVDVSLRQSSGVKVTTSMMSMVPTIRVIGVTRHTDRTFVAKMLGAGAWGYVLKQSPSSELLRAIRTVAGGDRFVDPSLQREVEVGSSRTRGNELTARGEPLTSIEEQVLRLVAQACSNEEIAKRLSIPVTAVAEWKSSGMAKAGLNSRLQVIAYAQLRGWQ
jgi:DNA-binding NarL/FixJ family response regulator